MTIKVLSWHYAPLKEILRRREDLAHAYLIHGRQGMGKVDFARALAQSLLCETPAPEGIACGECPACHWFGQGNHPDFREIVPDALNTERSQEDDGEIDAEGTKPEKRSVQITIDQVRDIGQFMSLSTHRGGFRILLVHPAEALNLAAANALLKTLEEPLPRTLILLVANQPGRLLATVRSRCQRLLVAAPGRDEALAWLQDQGVNEPDMLLSQAGGAPLLALRWADADFQAQRKAFLNALSDPARADWLAVAADYEKVDLGHVVHWLQTWCCDLIYQSSVRQIRHHRDFASALERLAHGARLPTLLRYESMLRGVRRSIAHPLNARLLLEQLLISYNQAVEAMVA
jgi:DNA polymerase III subunit delta'